MANQDFNNLSKLEITALLREKKSAETERYQELVNNVSAGKKNSKKSRELKRKIAHVETIISQKLQTQLLKEATNE